MKKLILTIFVLSFLIGCQQNDMLTSPENNAQVVVSEPSWLKLPGDNQSTLNKLFTVTKVIKCKRGGKLRLSFQNEAASLRGYADVRIPRYAWDKKKYGDEIEISMQLDDSSLMFTFLPSMEFNKNLMFGFEIEGLDLRHIVDENDVKFVYLAPDGTYQVLETDKIKIDVNKGIIEFIDSEIPHFSRFGFLN